MKFASDITAEKRKNAEHEGLIAAIGRSQAVISFSKDGIILDANDNFLAAVGYRLDEIRGKHHRMFVEEKYAHSEQYAEFWQTLAGGKHLSAIYQRFNKAGQPIWLQANYNPIFDASGNIMKVTKFATDITQNMTARQAAIEAAEETLNTVGQTAHSAQHVNSSAQGISQGMEKARVAVEAMHGRSEIAERSTEKLRLAAASMDGVVQLISKSRTRSTCCPSTRPSRLPAPARPAAALRSSPTRSRRWRTRPRRRRRGSSPRSPRCSRSPAPSTRR